MLALWFSATNGHARGRRDICKFKTIMFAQSTFVDLTHLPQLALGRWRHAALGIENLPSAAIKPQNAFLAKNLKSWRTLDGNYVIDVKKLKRGGISKAVELEVKRVITTSKPWHQEGSGGFERRHAMWPPWNLWYLCMHIASSGEISVGMLGLHLT